MDIAFEIEAATNEASAFKNLLLATTEAAFNGNYEPEEYEEAFSFLYSMAYRHVEHMEVIEKEAFKLLQENKENLKYKEREAGKQWME